LLLMAGAATVIGVGAGAAAGVSAAYLRGRTDGVIMRTVDVILAFPQLVFALLLLSILGPRLWLIVLAVAPTHAPAACPQLGDHDQREPGRPGPEPLGGDRPRHLDRPV
jgi:ABC-type dipeptide/oligopeptide/nickel transport system permease subunit